MEALLQQNVLLGVDRDLSFNYGVLHTLFIIFVIPLMQCQIGVA